MKNYIVLQELIQSNQYQLLHMLKNMLIKLAVVKIPTNAQLLENSYIDLYEVVEFRQELENLKHNNYKSIILIMINKNN